MDYMKPFLVQAKHTRNLQIHKYVPDVEPFIAKVKLFMSCYVLSLATSQWRLRSGNGSLECWGEHRVKDRRQSGLTGVKQESWAGSGAGL